jgi:hypothetical protein
MKVCLVWSAKLEQVGTWRYILVRGLILGIFFARFSSVVWSAKNLNKLALGDVTHQNFQVRGLILGTFSLDMAVWFGLQNLNKLALGDITRQNFPVSCLILGIFLLGIFWR